MSWFWPWSVACPRALCCYPCLLFSAVPSDCFLPPTRFEVTATILLGPVDLTCTPPTPSACRRVHADPGDRPPQRGQGLRQRQLCPQRGALHADRLLRGLLHPAGHHGGDLLPHHTGKASSPPRLLLSFMAPCLPPQVLQRQATVFLYEAKTSSQQPLHVPAPPTTFHIPQINTIAPSDSHGRSPEPETLTFALGCCPERLQTVAPET